MMDGMMSVLLVCIILDIYIYRYYISYMSYDIWDIIFHIWYKPRWTILILVFLLLVFPGKKMLKIGTAFVVGWFLEHADPLLKAKGGDVREEGHEHDRIVSSFFSHY